VTPRAFAIGAAVLALIATALPARHPALAKPKTAPRVRVGLVFDVGGRGDKSFNDSAFEGLLRAERELGAEISFLEPTGAEDREAALRLFAARHMDLVIGVGFIFSSDIDLVAQAYPSVSFACVDYAPSGDHPIPQNVAGLDFREEEGAFLVGGVAGKLTKTGHVGFVGGMTIPLIAKFEAGYAAGVKATCHTCVVHSAYAGASPDAFKDPAKGKLLAASEIAQGADVIFHASGSTGHGVFEAAREAHIYAIGVDSDQYDEMPGVVATSMIKRVDVAVFDAIKDAALHTFVGGRVIGLGIGDQGVDYVHEGEHAALLTVALKEAVEGLRQDVLSGRTKVPNR